MSGQVIRIALPHEDAMRGRLAKMALSSQASNPKIDTQANPAHAGIIFLTWNDTSTVPNDTTKLLDFFPHSYNKAPTVIASYSFDNGTVRFQGTLPFQNGALGMVLMDTDDTNVNLKYYSFDFQVLPLVPFTMIIRYYVMAEHGIDP